MIFPKPLTQSGSDRSLVRRPPSSASQGPLPVSTCCELDRLLLWVSFVGVGWPSGSPQSLSGQALAEGRAGIRSPGTSCALGPGSPAEPTVGRAPSFRGPIRIGDCRGFQDYLCPYLVHSLEHSGWGWAAKCPRAPSSSPVHFSGVAARGPRTPSQEGPSARGAEAGGGGLSALWQKKRVIF